MENDALIYVDENDRIVERHPKVLIAAPIGGHKQYSINLWFDWISMQTHLNYDVCICTNGKGYHELAEKVRQVEINDIHGNVKKIKTLELRDSDDLTFIQKITYAREKIRLLAINEGYDFLFFLDTDTIPAQKDAINRLIAWQKDVISGVYFYKHSKVSVIIDKDTKTNLTIEKMKEYVDKKELIEVWGFGFGCLLLSREAFANNAFDYDLFEETYTDDFGYCHVLEKAGFERWVDPFILCKHFADPDHREPVKMPMRLKVLVPPEDIKTLEAFKPHGKNEGRTKINDKGVDRTKCNSF